MSGSKFCSILLLLVMLHWAWAQDQEDINRAVDKGVAKIKREQDSIPYEGGRALCAWTLLEAGVKPKDNEDLQKNIVEVRKQALETSNTYAVVTSIFCLDKLGDPSDRPLIQALGAQLYAGLHWPSACWNYSCPALTKEEREKVLERMKAAGAKPPEKDGDAKPTLDADGKKLLNDLIPRGRDIQGSDNSNTQFAMMGLWVARRHGIPADPVLKKVDERFRKYSHPKGGWGYNIFINDLKQHEEPTAAMTCAGLLAMALGNGVKKEPAKDLTQDPQVKKALAALVEQMDQIDKNKEKFFDPTPDSVRGTKNFYMLWSLERVGVIYDVKDGKIGKHDWYKWGANYLINEYKDPGEWVAAHAVADTCFAVLFLKKANVAADLTKRNLEFYKGSIEKK